MAKKIDKSLKTVSIMVVVLGLIFLGIFFGIRYTKEYMKNTNTDTHVIYNNYEFNKYEDGKWYVTLAKNNQPYEIAFYYNPYEVENLTITNNTMIQFKNFMDSHPGGRVYITMNPDESSKVVVASVELAKLLGQRYNIFNFDVKAAFTKESDIRNVSDTGYPIITCANASKDHLIFWFAPANVTEVKVNSNCIAIKYADINESVRAADALAFRMLTITRE
jgi:hypothetical protein